MFADPRVARLADGARKASCSSSRGKGVEHIDITTLIHRVRKCHVHCERGLSDAGHHDPEVY
jgi:hypothetical protein